MTDPQNPGYPQYQPPQPPPYGQQPQQPPAWNQSPAGWPPPPGAPVPPPPQQAKKSSRNLWLGIVGAVVVAGAAVGIGFAVSGGDSGGSGGDSGNGGNEKTAKPVFPESFSGLSQLHSDTADQVASQIQSNWAGTAAAPLSGDATIVVYSKDASSPALIVVGFPGAEHGKFGSGKSREQIVDSLLSSAGSAKAYDTGNQGGVLKCATASSDDTTMCAWADQDVIGMSLAEATSGDDATQLVAVTNQLRDQTK